MTTDWLTVNPYLGSDNVLEFVDPTAGPHRHLRAGQDLQPVERRAPGPHGASVAGRTPTARRSPTLVARLIHRWGAGRERRLAASPTSAPSSARPTPTRPAGSATSCPTRSSWCPATARRAAAGADAVAGARPDGRGVLVSSSRAIMGAWQQRRPDDGPRRLASAPHEPRSTPDERRRRRRRRARRWSSPAIELPATARTLGAWNWRDRWPRTRQIMAADASLPGHGLLGVDVRGPEPSTAPTRRSCRSCSTTTDPDFDPTLLDSPAGRRATRPRRRVLAQEPFDHDAFRQRSSSPSARPASRWPAACWC